LSPMHRELFLRIRSHSDRVGIEGIQFYAYHGHRSEESTLGQRFELAVQAYLDLGAAGRSDHLEDTLNYQPPIPNFFGHVEVEITRVHPQRLEEGA